MGFVGNALGTVIGGPIGGLSQGINKAAGIQGANTYDPTNATQLENAYNNSQSALSEQQNFLKALQAQGGLQNQSNVYNQLQSVSNGTGANPAQAMLANATGANVANQAALAAGQRGAAQNVGMIARQAGMRGAEAQQNAAGQSAVLQANQSLGALGQMGNIAGQQVGNQANAAAAYNQAAGNQLGTLYGAQNAYNNASVQNQAGLNQANQKTAGGMFQAAGAAFGLAHGGEVPSQEKHPTHEPQSFVARHLKGMAEGGDVKQGGIGEGFRALGAAMDDQEFKPRMEEAPTQSTNAGYIDSPDASEGNTGNGRAVDKAMGFSGPATAFASKGGKVPVMLSPGEVYVPPNKVKEVADGKKTAKAAGRTVQGKAKVEGDSKKNDTVPAKLESGGVVVPRTQANSNDAAEKFVQAILAKNSMRSKK